MKLKIPLPEFCIKMGTCENKSEYSINTAFSSFNIFCQKVHNHPLKVNMQENKLTIIPIQTDNFAPNDRFLNGTPTGNPGVHKINNEPDETLQILGPTLVYNITDDARVKIVKTFIESSTQNDFRVLGIKKKLNLSFFDSHLQNKKNNEIHIFELNELITKNAKIVKDYNKNQELHVEFIKQAHNPVHQHTRLLFNKTYKDFSSIKTATHLAESSQDFFANSGNRYLMNDLKKMAIEQEKILTVTLKNNTFKNEIEFQKYYELKQSAIKVKNMIYQD